MRADDPRPRRRALGVRIHGRTQRGDVHEHGAVGAVHEGRQRGDDVRERRRDDDGIGRKHSGEGVDRVETGAPRGLARRGVGVVHAEVVRPAQRERERPADEAGAREPDLHARTALVAAVRPTARATSGTVAMSAAKFANVSDW